MHTKPWVAFTFLDDVWRPFNINDISTDFLETHICYIASPVYFGGNINDAIRYNLFLVF